MRKTLSDSSNKFVVIMCFLKNITINLNVKSNLIAVEYFLACGLYLDNLMLTLIGDDFINSFANVFFRDIF